MNNSAHLASVFHGQIQANELTTMSAVRNGNSRHRMEGFDMMIASLMRLAHNLETGGMEFVLIDR
jgi:hypothetical protein